MRVLSIGTSALETTCQTEVSLGEGMNVSISDFTECGGGYAGNVAYLLSKWGVETYIASMLGADDAANKIKKEYETIGVKQDYIETSFDRPTSKTVIVLNKSTKKRTVINLPSNSFLKKYMFAIEPDVIFSDSEDYNASVTAFDKNPKVLKFVGINAATKEAMELAKFANYIIINKSSAETLTNKQINYNDSSTVVNIYNELKQKYHGEIILTLGEMGSVYAINSQVKIMPPVKVDEVDSYGSGHIFTAVFLYGIGRNFGLEKAIAYATIASSLSISKLTSRGSIPSITEVSNYYDSKFGNQNNPVNKSELPKEENESESKPKEKTPEFNADVANQMVNNNYNKNEVNMNTEEGLGVANVSDLSNAETPANGINNGNQ